MVEAGYCAAAFRLGLGEADGRAPHWAAGGHGYAALPGIVHGTIEVIDHTVVFQHVALVGKHLVVGLRRPDEVSAGPVLPVDEVAADGEGVVGIVRPVGAVGREIEHHVEGVHTRQLGVAGDDAGCLVGVDGVVGIALPVAHILTCGYADALGFQVVGGVDAAGIVEHQESGGLTPAPVAESGRALRQLVDGALILCQLLPPLHVLIVNGEQGLVFLRLPLVRLAGIAARPRQSDVQRLAHRLVARACTPDVSHPVAPFIAVDAVLSTPVPVDERRESAALVHIPSLVAIAEQTAFGVPRQQVVAGCQPRLVAATVQSVLSVVHHVGHQPASALAEHRRAVYLVIVVLWCHHHTIFIRCAHLFVDLLHRLLRYLLCVSGRRGDGEQ